jgi:ubiquinone/menaquinone biosynthesis C-methylase UbiE
MKRKSTKADWERYWQSQDHQPQGIHQALLQNMEKFISVKGKKILEVGVGMGGDSLYLAKKGAQVTVLDFSEAALKQIKTSAQKEKVSLETVLADAQKMPFQKETFDIVFHQGFLEHFPDPQPYLLEQKRVLKKGGLLVIDVPQKWTTYTLKKHFQMWRGQWFAGWEKEFTAPELEKAVQKAGFEILTTYGRDYYGKLYQIRHLKLGCWYQKIWEKIEQTRLKLYLTFSLGVVAQKK